MVLVLKARKIQKFRESQSYKSRGEAPRCHCVKTKPKLPWRRQNIGAARSIAHLPRRAAIVKPSGPKPKTEASCAGGGQAARGRLPVLLGI